VNAHKGFRMVPVLGKLSFEIGELAEELINLHNLQKKSSS